MNPLIMLGPIGMMLVGLLSMLAWRWWSEVPLKYFLLGGIVWAAAMAPKALMDIAVTQALNSWARETFGVEGLLIVSSLYVGVRTGLLECGFTYLMFKRKLKQLSLDEAVAFGVGFGAFEAILLAAPAIIQIALLMSNPSILETLPKEAREAVEAQLSMPTWVVPAPIIERIFTLLAHVFATLMIYASVRERKAKHLLGSIFYKSLLDGAIPYVNWLFKPTASPIGVYMAETWIVSMGLIALAGTRYYLSRLARWGRQAK